MHVRAIGSRTIGRRAARVAATLALSTSLVVGAIHTIPALGADLRTASGTAELRVAGTLVRLSGQEAQSGADATTLLPERVQLLTSGGAAVDIAGPLVENAETGASFAGSVTIPTNAVADIAAELGGGRLPVASVVDADTPLGEDLLAASDAQDVPLTVLSGSVTEADAIVPAAAHSLTFAVATLPARSADIIVSDSDLEEYAHRLSSYWNSQSGGQVANMAQVGPVDRFTSASACDADTVWSEATARLGASKSSWVQSPSKHLIVIVPESCGGGSGFGSVGSTLMGGLAWISFSAPVAELTLAHELGHNLSLRHSNAVECGVGMNEGVSCADSEYRDFYDVMGGGLTVNGDGSPQLMALNVSHKSSIDALDPASLVAVRLAPGASGATTNHVLAPASAASGVRGLRITDPGTGETYFVEYRSGTGIDAGSIYARSVYPGHAPGVRVLTLRADLSSAVFTVPAANSTVRNRFLPSGQAFVSKSGKVRVTVTAVGGTATVKVQLGSVATPLTAGTPTIRGTAAIGDVLTAEPGSWNPAPTSFEYQWRRDAAPIPGATGPTLALSEAERGTRISVLVTGIRSGYTRTIATSAETGPVVGSGASVVRVGGADRFETAVRVSSVHAPGVPVVYVASGANYPDALSAAPAAAAGGGPLLLTLPSEVPDAVIAELRRLRPASIVVVGGTASVSAASYAELATLAPKTTRVWGADRYATSRAVVQHAFGATGADRVYLATGRNFPDALSASAAAGAQDGAVLLVDGEAATLDAAATALLRRIAPGSVALAGGTHVLSAGIETAAMRLGFGGGVTRMAGADRFGTSRMLNADTGFAFHGAESVYLANGYSFPDALAGAALAGLRTAPLYIVPGNCVPVGIRDDITDFAPATIVLLGGRVSMTSAVESLTPCG